MTTPLGFLQVAQKIGDHAPVGAVFHNRRFTGEVLAAERSWPRSGHHAHHLAARSRGDNAHAFADAFIFMARREEKFIGRPASYGCIRMKSNDVADLYNQLTSARSSKSFRIVCRKSRRPKISAGIPERERGAERHSCPWREKHFKRARAAFGRSRLKHCCKFVRQLQLNF